jgi:hypothetical protein
MGPVEEGYQTAAAVRTGSSSRWRALVVAEQRWQPRTILVTDRRPHDVQVRRVNALAAPAVLVLEHAAGRHDAQNRQSAFQPSVPSAAGDRARGRRPASAIRTAAVARGSARAQAAVAGTPPARGRRVAPTAARRRRQGRDRAPADDGVEPAHLVVEG